MGKGEGSGAGSGEGAGDGSGAYKGKSERIAVPAMPYPMSITCCILNFIFPGLGTMVAGFSVFCCSRNEDMEGATRFVSCLTSFGIGLLQLLTTILFLVGWIWSIAWGIFFIGMSAEYYYNNKVHDHDGTAGVIVHSQPTHIVIHSGGQTMVTGQPTTTVLVSNINQPVGPRFGPSINQQAVMAVQSVNAQQMQPSGYNMQPSGHNIQQPSGYNMQPSGYNMQPGPSSDKFPAPPPYTASAGEKNGPPSDPSYPPPPPAYM